MTFGGSLVRNACFGDLTCDFLEEVSYENARLAALKRVSSQIECPTRVSRMSAPQECPTRVSRKSVP